MTLSFSTRSNDGQVHDHFHDLETALDYFISEGGYRLDFHFSDGKVLHIHRGEYGEDLPEQRWNHPAFDYYSQANAKVLFYDPQKTKDCQEPQAKIYYLDLPMDAK